MKPIYFPPIAHFDMKRDKAIHAFRHSHKELSDDKDFENTECESVLEEGKKTKNT